MNLINVIDKIKLLFSREVWEIYAHPHSFGSDTGRALIHVLFHKFLATRTIGFVTCHF